jgi:hypothetical protein
MMRNGGRLAARDSGDEPLAAADPPLHQRLEAIEKRLEGAERDLHNELVEIEGRIAQALAARFRDEITALRAEVNRTSSRP